MGRQRRSFDRTTAYKSHGHSCGTPEELPPSDACPEPVNSPPHHPTTAHLPPPPSFLPSIAPAPRRDDYYVHDGSAVLPPISKDCTMSPARGGRASNANIVVLSALGRRLRRRTTTCGDARAMSVRVWDGASGRRLMGVGRTYHLDCLADWETCSDAMAAVHESYWLRLRYLSSIRQCLEALSVCRKVRL